MNRHASTVVAAAFGLVVGVVGVVVAQAPERPVARKTWRDRDPVFAIVREATGEVVTYRYAATGAEAIVDYVEVWCRVADGYIAEPGDVQRPSDGRWRRAVHQGKRGVVADYRAVRIPPSWEKRVPDLGAGRRWAFRGGKIVHEVDPDYVPEVGDPPAVPGPPVEPIPKPRRIR